MQQLGIQGRWQRQYCNIISKKKEGNQSLRDFAESARLGQSDCPVMTVMTLSTLSKCLFFKVYRVFFFIKVKAEEQETARASLLHSKGAWKYIWFPALHLQVLKYRQHTCCFCCTQIHGLKWNEKWGCASIRRQTMIMHMGAHSSAWTSQLSLPIP